MRSTLKLLAIADNYIPPEYMQAGFAPLAELGVGLEVRYWSHPTLVDLQQANLAIEKGGPEAVRLPADLRADVADFDLVAVQFAPLDADFIEAAARLKVIAVLRGGTENVDVACATRRGIAVLNTPGRLSRAVAECTVGLILAEVRNLARGHARLLEGRWERAFPNTEDIPELYRRTVGLVGYGAVGQMVAGYLQAFGCRILAHDPYFRGDPAPAALTDLPTLLMESDVVSLHARLCPETEHLIGARQLALMKPSAVLINTARSELVEMSAVVAALNSGQLAGYGTDVLETEPPPKDHPLFACPTAVITPHIGSRTYESVARQAAMAAENLIRSLKGQRPLAQANQV